MEIQGKKVSFFSVCFEETIAIRIGIILTSVAALASFK